MDYGVSSYSHPFNQTSFDGMSDPLLYPLMINPHLKTRYALRGDMVFDDVAYLLTPFRENDNSQQLVAKARAGLEHDMVVISKAILLKMSI